MSRRISCSLTPDAVRDRTKTVTRRAAHTWATLCPGDRLTIVEQAMGLPRGATQTVLAEVEVVDVRLEPLSAVTDDEVHAEGFPDMDAPAFVEMWLETHHVRRRTDADALALEVRRIEWRYLDPSDPPRPPAE